MLYKITLHWNCSNLIKLFHSVGFTLALNLVWMWLVFLPFFDWQLVVSISFVFPSTLHRAPHSTWGCIAFGQVIVTLKGYLCKSYSERSITSYFSFLFTFCLAGVIELILSSPIPGYQWPSLSFPAWRQQQELAWLLLTEPFFFFAATHNTQTSRRFRCAVFMYTRILAPLDGPLGVDRFYWQGGGKGCNRSISFKLSRLLTHDLKWPPNCRRLSMSKIAGKFKNWKNLKILMGFNMWIMIHGVPPYQNFHFPQFVSGADLGLLYSHSILLKFNIGLRKNRIM